MKQFQVMVVGLALLVFLSSCSKSITALKNSEDDVYYTPKDDKFLASKHDKERLEREATLAKINGQNDVLNSYNPDYQRTEVDPYDFDDYSYSHRIDRFYYPQSGYNYSDPYYCPNNPNGYAAQMHRNGWYDPFYNPYYNTVDPYCGHGFSNNYYNPYGNYYNYNGYSSGWYSGYGISFWPMLQMNHNMGNYNGSHNTTTMNHNTKNANTYYGTRTNMGSQNIYYGTTTTEQLRKVRSVDNVTTQSNIYDANTTQTKISNLSNLNTQQSGTETKSRQNNWNNNTSWSTDNNSNKVNSNTYSTPVQSGTNSNSNQNNNSQNGTKPVLIRTR